MTPLTAARCFYAASDRQKKKKKKEIWKVSFMILNEASIWVKAEQEQKRGFVAEK